MTNFCKVIFTALPLVLCSLVSYAQPRTGRHPKEIIALINICKTDTDRIKLELELGYYYVTKPGAYKDDMDSAFNVFDPALKECKIINSKKLENETLKLRGDAYLEQENLDSGKLCFMQVINYDHTTGNVKQEAKDWERYGWCIQYGTLQEMQNRKMAFERAIILYKNTHNQPGEIRALSQLPEVDYWIHVEESDLQRANLQKYLILSGLIILLLITALIYNGYRRNKRNNLILQHKQAEINLQNNSLQELNKKQEELINEREWLLREIHHRVKNNLQTTMSLLNMQTNYLSSTDAIDAIRNSQRRMYAMSLVHQKLYQSDNLSTINIKSFINELVQYLSESFHRSNEIGFELFIDNIELDLAMAIPVGLIINEAVTNSIKYAFPDNRSGKIVIGFIHKNADGLLLTIKDDGIGLPEEINSETNNTLGLNLIKGLTSQIEGKIEIYGESGMSLKIMFKNIRQKEQ